MVSSCTSFPEQVFSTAVWKTRRTTISRFPWTAQSSKNRMPVLAHSEERLRPGRYLLGRN